MQSTGERFIPTHITDKTELEHLNRYYFVVNQLVLKGKYVVDLASGEGYGSNILAHFADNVVGIDLSNEAIEYAKKKYSKSNLNFILGDAIRIPLENNTVDVFVSFETIEHHNQHELMMNEILRILKPDGILVMSSPDKKNYSDIPKFVNQFHIKELYYDEFKSLISNYFNTNYFFIQRLFSGSIITIDSENSINKTPLIVDENGNSEILQPVYNIVISSNNNEMKLPHSHIFYGDINTVITEIDVEASKYDVKMSAEFQLGKMILKRLKFLRPFFEKL